MGVGEFAGNKDARPAQTRKTMRKDARHCGSRFFLRSRGGPLAPPGGWGQGSVVCVHTLKPRDDTHKNRDGTDIDNVSHIVASRLLVS